MTQPSDNASALDTSHPFGGDPAAEGTPVDGGIATIGYGYDTDSFDPVKVKSANDSAYAIYDSLMKLDENGDAQPYLAESMSTPDAGTTWILKLRPGVLFHDGTTLDADAVIFNVQRHIDITTSSSHQIASMITSMTAVDHNTARFVLERPYGSFPEAFAMRFALGTLGAIASPTAIEKWGPDYGRNPVGAGPFQLKEWIPDSQLVLTKFDRYWQQGLPHLDELVFRVLPDTESRYASLVNGDIDVDLAIYHSEVLRGSADDSLDVYYGPGGGGNMVTLNNEKPPFNDRRMREALIRSIDLNALNLTQFKGAMDFMQTAFPPDSPYYNKSAADAYPAYDPEKAKQLINEYREAGGDPTFTLNTTTAPNNVALSQFLQAQLAAVGLNVPVETLELTGWLAKLNGGEYQAGTAVNGPWSGPYPEFVTLYGSGQVRNWSNYSNPEMDAALDKGASTTDRAVRIAAYQEAEMIASRDLPVAWLSRAYSGVVTRNNVHGVVIGREVFWAAMWKSSP